MANPEHLAKLKEGVKAWNAFAAERPELVADFARADLAGMDLTGVYLERANLIQTELADARLQGANLWCARLNEANLRNAHLRQANLFNADLNMALLKGANLVAAKLGHAIFYEAELEEADLRAADLQGANLRKVRGRSANLSQANLQQAHLEDASLGDADLRMADFRQADLSGARLTAANLFLADLRQANLRGANLSKAYLTEADLRDADLTGAELEYAHLIKADLSGATLTGCRVYAVSAWDVRLDGAIQSSLSITPRGEDHPAIEVDNLEVAQFLYLLLNNQKIRQVIDTITSKLVLILGRFTEERKAVLDAIREELRKRDYLPVLFDFEKPESRNLTETITTLAKLSRFIIADLTDPSCSPYEVGRIVPETKVALQAIILDGQRPFAMFSDLLDYPWVLPPYRYRSAETLLANLNEVIAPAEAKAKELIERSRGSA